MRRAIFPGTFDPFTIGHYSVVKRALTFMDEVVIGIGISTIVRELLQFGKDVTPFLPEGMKID